MIIDTHAHLTDDAFKDTLDTIIQNLNNDNLKYVFTIGYDLQSSKDCVNLAQTHQNVYAIVGFHPSDIEQTTPENLQWLNQIASHPKVLGIGEIGLDLHYQTNNLPQQIAGFIEQLKIAQQHNLPVVIHTRDASLQLLQVLSQNKHLLTNGGIVHCYSENLEFYNQISKLGLIISVGGTLTFKNSQQLQQTIRQIPLTQIVLETDSPYLTPVPHRGKFPNEPKNTNYVAQTLAQIMNLPISQIEETTNQTVYKLFKKLK